VNLFLPNPERAVELDRSVRGRVADSLSAVRTALAKQLPEAEPILGRLVDALAAGPVRPGVIAVYADLVTAIQAKDASALASALKSAEGLDVSVPVGLRAATLCDEDLGPGLAASFLRHIDDDPDVPIDARPISAAELAVAKGRLDQALTLIAEADPALAGEVRALVRQVVFAAPGGDAPEFGGTTSFYLWGAQVQNIHCFPDAPALAEAVVHESAHSLLFGWSTGAPLVDNDPQQLFPSPMRDDPRPMDGVVHASFVVARLHYLATRPQMAGTTLPSLADDYEKRFRATDEIIMRHGRFTSVGEPLYRSARQYMLGG